MGHRSFRGRCCTELSTQPRNSRYSQATSEASPGRSTERARSARVHCESYIEDHPRRVVIAPVAHEFGASSNERPL
jgi:hypothetical protein